MNYMYPAKGIRFFTISSLGYFGRLSGLRHVYRPDWNSLHSISRVLTKYSRGYRTRHFILYCYLYNSVSVVNRQILFDLSWHFYLFTQFKFLTFPVGFLIIFIHINLALTITTTAKKSQPTTYISSSYVFARVFISFVIKSLCYSLVLYTAKVNCIMSDKNMYQIWSSMIVGFCGVLG